MGGKKWCEYCRLNIEYTKQAIQAHQQTRLHQQNKQRSIKHDMHQNRKQAISNRKSQIEARKNGTAAPGGTAAISNLPPLGPPKPKISQEKLMEIRKRQDQFKSQAFSKIHSLIAERTKGQFGAPVQFPESNPLLLKDTYYDKHAKAKPTTTKKTSEHSDDEDEDEDNDAESGSGGSEDDSEDVRMWRIELCDQTGKACFVNNITGTKLYDKPTGFVLSEKQQQQWEQMQRYIEQNPQKDPNEEGNVGEWEEVPQEEDYFKANALPEEEESESQIQQLEDIERPRTLHQQQLVEIEKKILNGEITTADQVVGLMINSAAEQTGESLREKNAKLKRLIETNVQQTMRMDRAKELDNPDHQIHKAEGFKPRKQVKKVVLTTQQDIY